jgi:modification methylase
MQGKVIIGDSRRMREVSDASVDLVVTSPPYWHIKDYGQAGQIGYGQSLHEYLRGLYAVWSECARVLRPGARLCINVGDQFARAAIYGRYKVIPIHAELIAQCERVGLDFMGSIIWQKKTTMNTTGGAAVMGSYPYPPNGIVELDYEFILLFKKPGQAKTVPKEVKEASEITKEEWKEWFLGHWAFGGTKQTGHEAMFPEELPRRLIRMFTFVGDTVLDPFLGSGTTLKATLDLERNGVGYEINPDYLDTIRQKVGARRAVQIETIGPIGPIGPMGPIEENPGAKGEEAGTRGYVPAIQDANPQMDPTEFDESREVSYKVKEIVDPCALRLDTGHHVRLIGVRCEEPEKTLAYLRKRVLNKRVLLKDAAGKWMPPIASAQKNGPIEAYVYLKNRIFVNKYLVQSGLCVPDASREHKWKAGFAKWAEEATEQNANHG